ncbi:hypothetical protein BW063_004774 [Salmonella enterica subsp. enterica serovar Saintpaul]|nr:hypothetical protein [Salmonella enterica subsp. enterica serovar Saintpaul]
MFYMIFFSLWMYLKILSPFVKNPLIFSEKSSHPYLKIFSPYVKDPLTLR